MPQQFTPYSYGPICSNPINASASMSAPMPMYNVPEHVPFRAHEIKASDKFPVCINLNTKKDGYDLTHEENNVGKVYALYNRDILDIVMDAQAKKEEIEHNIRHNEKMINDTNFTPDTPVDKKNKWLSIR